MSHATLVAVNDADPVDDAAAKLRAMAPGAVDALAALLAGKTGLTGDEKRLADALLAVASKAGAPASRDASAPRRMDAATLAALRDRIDAALAASAKPVSAPRKAPDEAQVIDIFGN